MRFALYHPRIGYYATRVKGIGRLADFATAPTISPLLGHAIARWMTARRRHRAFRPWNIIEIGGGDGSLALSIWRTLSLPARAGMRYHIVEVSAPLRQVQATRLKGRHFRWHDAMGAAIEQCGGDAVIIANEVVDAFPAVQWEWCGGRWREIGVRLGDGDPREVHLEPDVDRVLRWYPERIRCAAHPREGDRIEMQLSYAEWFASWASGLSRGTMLTIDYGAPAPAPIPGGSMRAYWHHQALRGNDIYLRPGRQDLTADVDFGALKRWGEQHGLHTVWGGSQGDFIRQWAGDRVIGGAAVFLTNEAGAGGAFRVLEQRWGAAS